MSETEMKALEIIWEWGGEASIDTIARKARVSIDYARLICRNLDKEGYIDFSHSKLCEIKSKGKMAVAGRRSRGSQRVAIPQKPGKFGLGKDKKGRLVLDY